ncbi:MOSC domain protein, partial [Aspergillus sclerotialis]
KTHPKGCRRLGSPPSQSNLHDEYNPKYNQGVPNNHIDEKGRKSWRIKALFTYPIKSCAGIELDQSDVITTGLLYDREFCFAEYVTPSNIPDGEGSGRWDLRTLRDGRFCKLALLRPEIWVPDPSAGDYDLDLEEVNSGGVMIIYYPRVPSGFLEKLGISLGLISSEYSFTIPLCPPNPDICPSLPVKIWKDYPLAYNYGQYIPQSLRDFLQSPSPSPTQKKHLTLFRLNPSHTRQIYRNAPRKEELGFQSETGFADAYPIHLLNISSVRDVAMRCAKDIPNLSIRRFRPNIVIQGPGAFEEDHWKRIMLLPRNSPCEEEGRKEGVEIHTVCRTVRCRLPNVDPDTGIRHPVEPDRTLKSYRRIDPGCMEFACLGMQLVPNVREFTVSVGDEIAVSETGEHFYIRMLAKGEKVPGE